MRRRLAFLLSAIPAASVLFLILKLSVNVLCWDEWEMVPLVQKSYEGRLSLSDFTEQYHEHRPVVSRLILLATARLTHWNTIWEIVINFVLAGGIVAVIGWQTRKLPWVLPMVSIAVFSIAAYENWLMGWQVALFLVTLSVVWAIVLLSNKLTWAGLCGAVILGWIATYSLANGMLIWPIGLALLWKRENQMLSAWWTGAALLAIGLYFNGYHKPPEHPALAINLDVIAYVLKFIGGVCAQTELNHGDGDLALVCGTGALTAFGWVCWKLRSREIVPYVALAAYSLGTAILCGIGRTGFGTNQALSSRYCTLAAPFWASLIVLLAMVLNHDTSRWTKTIAQWSLALVAFALIAGSVIAIGSAKEMNKVLVNARCELMEIASGRDTEIVSLCPNPQLAVERYPVLVKYRLLGFDK